VKQATQKGGDDTDILQGMVDYMATFNQLLDFSAPTEMDTLCRLYPGFYRFAKLLENLADAIRDGCIEVPAQ
jgi:hypothetical protein